MAKKLLQGLAITFGGGLALGAGFKLGQAATKQKPTGGADLTILHNRLNAFEQRITQAESRPPAGGPGPLNAEDFPSQVLNQTLSSLEARLAGRLEAMGDHLQKVEVRFGGELEALAGRQATQANALSRRLEEIQGKLHSEIEAGDRRSHDQIASFAQELKKLDSRFSGEIDAAIGARIGQLNAKLEKELQQAQDRTLEALVQTIDTKVVQRISDLENSLVGQSEAIGGLRDKSLRTDQNMQKLLLAVERLCDQAERQMAQRGEAMPESSGHSPGSPHAEIAPPQPALVETEAARTEPAEPQVIYAVYEPAPPVADGADSEVYEPPSFLTAPTPVETATPVNGFAVPSEPPSFLAAQAPVEAATPIEAFTVPIEPAAELEMVGVAVAQAEMDPAVLDLLAPDPKPKKRWRIPLAFSMLTVAGGLTGLQLMGVLDSQAHQGPSAARAASPNPPKPPTVATPPSTDADVQELLQRLSADPNNVGVLNQLGRAYAGRKEWQLAEQAYRKALALNQQSQDAVLGLSDSLYQQQKFDESAAVLGKLSSVR